MTTYGIGEWRMRNGGMAVVEHKDGYGTRCLVGTVCGHPRSWRITGHYLPDNESPFDLVAPWEEPAPDPAGTEIKAWLMRKAIDDVIAERKRQIKVEGFDAAHDSKTQGYEQDLAIAAACYAHGSDDPEGSGSWWPFLRKWWKPTTPRRNYVKAAALLIAAIEKIDREQG